jgi:hypothetical protein
VPEIRPPGWVEPEKVVEAPVIDPKEQRAMTLRKEATLRDKVGSSDDFSSMCGYS